MRGGSLLKGRLPLLFGECENGGGNPLMELGFFNPRTREHEQWVAPDDTKAGKRLVIKGTAQYGRGYVRRHIQAPASG